MAATSWGRCVFRQGRTSGYKKRPMRYRTFTVVVHFHSKLSGGDRYDVFGGERITVAGDFIINFRLLLRRKRLFMWSADDDGCASCLQKALGILKKQFHLRRGLLPYAARDNNVQRTEGGGQKAGCTSVRAGIKVAADTTGPSSVSMRHLRQGARSSATCKGGRRPCDLQSQVLRLRQV